MRNAPGRALQRADRQRGPAPEWPRPTRVQSSLISSEVVAAEHQEGSQDGESGNEAEKEKVHGKSSSSDLELSERVDLRRGPDEETCGTTDPNARSERAKRA